MELVNKLSYGDIAARSLWALDQFQIITWSIAS